jgi:MFS family permease
LSPTFAALSVRNYRLYTTGAIISNVGTWMQRVAQDWLVLQLTGSGTALGITTGLQFLPFVLVTPMAGLLADRYSKKRVLQVTQAVLAVTAGLLGILAVTGLARPWHVYVLAFMFGVGTAFDTPTRQSFVVEMVGPDHLTNAIGINSASFNLGRIVGPAVAGFMIAALGSGARATGWVIFINAASYLAVIVSLRRMRDAELFSPELVAREPRAIRAGVRYVRQRPLLMFVFTVAFFAGTFGMNFQITSVLMATRVFDKGAGEYGILGSAMAIGSLAGALLAARRGRPRTLLLVVAACAFGLIEVGTGLMPSYWTFAISLPFLGIAALTMLNSLQATVQLAVEPGMRGRVMALYMMILMGGTPAGAPVIGWVGSTFGARWTLIGGGAITVLAVLAATAWLVRHEDIDVREVAEQSRRFARAPG